MKELLLHTSGPSHSSDEAEAGGSERLRDLLRVTQLGSSRMKVQIQSPGPGSCILNRRPFLSLSQSLGEGVVRAVNDPRILKRSRAAAAGVEGAEVEPRPERDLGLG